MTPSAAWRKKKPMCSSSATPSTRCALSACSNTCARNARARTFPPSWCEPSRCRWGKRRKSKSASPTRTWAWISSTTCTTRSSAKAPRSPSGISARRSWRGYRGLRKSTTRRRVAGVRTAASNVPLRRCRGSSTLDYSCIAHAIPKHAFGLGAREIQESARAGRKPLADGIDEMPVALEGESFNVQANEPGQYRIQAGGVTGEHRHAEPSENCLTDRLVGAQLHADCRREAVPCEQPENDHPRSRARLAHQERLAREARERDVAFTCERVLAAGKDHQRVGYDGLGDDLRFIGRLDQHVKVVLVF